MGVYGLHTWGEYFARQLAQELREEQQRVARILSRMERTQALIAADSPVNRGVEPLGCPACKARFDLGDHCPSCDVELDPFPLVPEPIVHLVAPGGALDTPLDCYRDSCAAPAPPLDWGTPGTPADDPEMWTFPLSPGVEGIRVLAPSPGAYTVLLAADPDGGAVASRGWVRVYVDGVLALEQVGSASSGAPAAEICMVEFPRGEVQAL